VLLFDCTPVPLLLIALLSMPLKVTSKLDTRMPCWVNSVTHAVLDRDRGRRVTLSVLAALMTMPAVPATRTDPMVSLQLSVIDLVIVTAPKPPGSRHLISPDRAGKRLAARGAATRISVVANAGTQVLLAWACTGADAKNWDYQSEG
jgi:hypothetical protein